MSEAAIAIVETTSAPIAPVAQSESAALISMIERAARDPAVNIDKMERLFEMQQRMQAVNARMAFDAAFAAMQPELPEIDKRGKIVIKKKDSEEVIQSTPYALWEDTNKLIKPILAKHNFGLSFRISQTEAKITTTAVLSHIAGHREETSFSASIDSTGSKNNVQGWGSSFSYGKRYTGTAILNISTKGEDDDGKKAGEAPTITDEQVIALRDIILSVEADETKFAQYMKVERLADLPASAFDRAKEALLKKGRK